MLRTYVKQFFFSATLKIMRRKNSPSGFELLRDNKLRMFGDRKDSDADCQNFRSRATTAQRVQRCLHRTKDVFDAAQGSAVLEAENGVFRKGSRPFARLKLFSDVCGGFSLRR